jgi:hypothetical protein
MIFECSVGASRSSPLTESRESREADCLHPLPKPTTSPSTLLVDGRVLCMQLVQAPGASNLAILPSAEREKPWNTKLASK